MPDPTNAGPADDRRTPSLRPRQLLYAAAAWTGMVVLALLNATGRELFVTPTVGDYAAHVISTATLLLLLSVYAVAYLRRRPAHTPLELAVVGLLWAGLTVAFEVTFGLYVAGDTLAELGQQYDVTRGYVWSLVPLFLLVAPTLIGRPRAGTRPAIGEPPAGARSPLDAVPGESDPALVDDDTTAVPSDSPPRPDPERRGETPSTTGDVCLLDGGEATDMDRSPSDTDAGVHEGAFGPDDTTVSRGVVDAVASFHDADPTEIPPLYTAIDPDALDTLFHAPLPTPDPPIEVTFPYADLLVTVTGEETIRLSESP